jgi:hypothetical protein
MAFAGLHRLGLIVIAALALAACDAFACSIGCDEEKSDCIENPDAYVLGRCGHASGPEPNACQRQYCEDLHAQCSRDCNTTELSPEDYR